MRRFGVGADARGAVRLSACLAAGLLASTCLTGVAQAQTRLASMTSVDDSGGGWGGLGGGGSSSSGSLALPPPIRLPADANGVDLSTGAFTYSVRELSIGSGLGELTYDRAYLGGGWRDNHTGTINKDGAKYYVSLGSTSESFTLNGSTYISDQGTGASLTFDGAIYTYRSRTGMTALFAKSLAGSSPSNANEGRVTSVTHPSGLTLTYAYKAVTTSTGTTAQRLQSVSNNLGYQLKFTYQAATGTGSTTLTKVTGINLAVDYCDPTADVCSNLTVAWPSTTYSGATVTDAAGRVTTYGYNGPQLTSIQAPGLATRTIGYNSLGQATSISNGTGSWTYGYATSTTTVTAPLSRVRTYTIDATNGLITAERDPLGRTTSYTYDTLFRPKRTTGPDGGYTEIAYDARGNIVSSTRVAKAGSGLGDIVVSAGYDASCANLIVCNLPTYTIDARGGRTDLEYDPVHGGVTKVTSPAKPDGVRPEVRYQYSALNASYKNSATTFQSGSAIQLPTGVSTCATLASCTGSANETKTTLAYAHANLLTTSTTTAAGDGSLSATSAMTYDPVGNLLTVDGPLAGAVDTTRYRYDGLRRVVGVVGPDPDGAGALKNRAARVTYHANGQQSSVEQGTVIDQSDSAWTAFAALQQQTADYDTLGRMTRQAVVASGTTYSLIQYAYDNADRLTCQALRMNPAAFASAPAACSLGATGADGADRITKYDYDNADQPTKVTTGYASTRPIVQVQATYEAATGRLATLADGKGNLTTYEYDGLGRTAKIRYPSTLNGAVSSTTDFEQYTYDPASNVAQIRRRDGQVVTLGYDSLNRLTTGMDGTTYTYDNLGHLTSASLSGKVEAFGYDALGRNISQAGALGTVGYQYDAAGRRTRITWPDGLWVSYDYDPTGALVAVRETGATSGAGALATYAYDDLGRRKTITRGNGVVTTYGYDPASRLTSLSHDLAGTANDATYTFAYNAAFQIKSRALSNAVYETTEPGLVDRSYEANGLNQLTKSGGLSVSYDLNGNLTSDGVSAYGYDIAGRLTSAPGATLSYDALGRLSQVSSTSTTRFAYDGVNLVGEYDAGGALLRRYVPGAGIDEPLAWYEGSGTGDRRWLASDNLGSIVATINDTGALVRANTYDEYGIPGAANLGRFQYTGQAWLPEAGLYHYKARTYSATLGRFMQPDPAGYADGLNLYAYVRNDPINFVDPSGLDTDLPECDAGMPADSCQVNVIGSRCSAGATCYSGGWWFFNSLRSMYNDQDKGGGGGGNWIEDLVQNTVCKAPSIGGSAGVDAYAGLGASLGAGVSVNPQNGQVSIGFDVGVGAGIGGGARVSTGKAMGLGKPSGQALPWLGGGINVNATAVAGPAGGTASYQVIGSNKGDWSAGYTGGAEASANVNVSAHGQINLPAMYNIGCPG